MTWDYTVCQAILECSSISAKYEAVLQTLMTEMEVYRIKKEFQEKVKAAIENMTGLEVADVNIRVAGVEIPEEA